MSQPIIKRERVKVRPRASQTDCAPVHLIQDGDPAPVHGQKAVRLLEEGGRVRVIEFTCSCGELTTVELSYPGEAVPE